jgi:hypothetical protein
MGTAKMGRRRLSPRAVIHQVLKADKVKVDEQTFFPLIDGRAIARATPGTIVWLIGSGFSRLHHDENMVTFNGVATTLLPI